MILAFSALALSCAGPRAEGDPLERERAAALDEASLSLASLRPLVASLPRELQPLRQRVDEGEATEALQRALVGFVDRASALADDAEGSLEPVRAMRQPQGVLDRLEEEAAAVATEARASAVQALELAGVVSGRTGGIAEPAPQTLDFGDRAATPELQDLLEGAALSASKALARSIASQKLVLPSLVVIPVAVSLDVPARTDSANVYGRLFSRRLVDSLRKARLPAAFSSQCSRDLEASRDGDAPALLSGSLALSGPNATFSLSVVDLRRRKELAIVTGTFTPARQGW